MSLQEIDRRIRETRQLLAASPDTEGVQAAIVRLDLVDDLLVTLVVDEGVPTELASRFGRVRDQLGAHVQVACELDKIGLPDETVTSMLREGVALAQAEIQAISDEAKRTV